MVSTSSSSAPLSPIDIIFSCSICQATISELYRRPRTDHGFSSDGSGKERVVTQLWLTECGHLTCSAHIEGGGVPFYPEGQRPSAPCPRCASEKGDNTSRVLFRISGRHPDQYDKDIPKEYFKVPPEKLNGDSISASALRFQYSSILRFASAMSSRYHDARRASVTAQAHSQDLATSLQETRAEAVELRAKIERLRSIETKYKKFKEREPEIRHYLGNCAGLAKENNQLKSELIRLGYSVPQTSWAYNAQTPLEKDGVANGSPPKRAAAAQYNTPSSELKRAHEENLADPRENMEETGVQDMNQRRADGHPVEVYANGRWQIARARDRPPSVHEPEQPNLQGDYMMSGALPPGIKTVAIRNHGFSSSTHPDRIPSQTHNPREQHPSIEAISDKHIMKPSNKNTQMRSPYIAQDLPPEEQEPMLATPRFSAMRQPLGQALAHGSLHQRQSGAQITTDMVDNGFLSARNRPIPSRHDDTLGRRAINPTTSPFLYEAQTIQRHPSQLPMAKPPIPLSRSGRVALNPDYSRMDLDATPPMAQSLNSLSFVQEPYTSMNKPIYTRPATRTSFSRAAPTWNPGPVTYTSQGRLHNPSQDAAGIGWDAPAFRPPQQLMSRRANVDIGGLKGVKGSSISVPSFERQFSMTAFDSRFPYQQQRGLNTASGRRSVRR